MGTLSVDSSQEGFFGKAVGRLIRMVRNIKRDRVRTEVMKNMNPLPLNPVVDCEVSYLLCFKDFDMGMIAAWFLLRFSTRKIKLRFFEDGSLTEDQWIQLKTLFPGHDFLPRSEVDMKIEAHFGKDSNIVKVRKQNPLFHKLVDIPFLSQTGRATYSDPDILYFTDPVDLLNAACSDSEISYFNRDMESSYFYSTEILKEMLGRTIPERINAGMYSVPVSSLDFGKLEKYLGEKPFSDFWKSWRVEQTLFAVLTSENGREVKWLPESYDVEYHKDVTKVPCKHYVGWIRHGFELEGLRYLLKKGWG